MKTIAKVLLAVLLVAACVIPVSAMRSNNKESSESKQSGKVLDTTKADVTSLLAKAKDEAVTVAAKKNTETSDTKSGQTQDQTDTKAEETAAAETEAADAQTADTQEADSTSADAEAADAAAADTQGTSDEAQAATDTGEEAASEAAPAQTESTPQVAPSGIAVSINQGYTVDINLGGNLYNQAWDIVNHATSSSADYSPEWGAAMSLSDFQAISNALTYSGFMWGSFSYSDGGDGTIYNLTVHPAKSTILAAAYNNAAVTQGVRDIVNSVVTDGMDQSAALLALNNRIAELVTYSDGNYDFGTAILNGYYGNCTVYADLFRLSAKMIGVNATLIEGYANGADHAWNYVPGYGYIDVTFNDSTGNAYLFSGNLWADHGGIYNEYAA